MTQVLSMLHGTISILLPFAMVVKIHPVNPEQRLIDKVAERIIAGGLVVYPTDTIYGLGCSVEDRDAIARVYLLKKQRDDRPFSFICSDLSHISDYAHVNNQAFRLIKRLIPGPYTFILPSAPMKHLPKILISRRRTVGIRVPDHPIVSSLVRTIGHPILSTSVTGEDGEILREPSEIIAAYRNRVEVIVDGGPSAAVPSTVLDLTQDEPAVVRMGAGLFPP